MDYSTSTKPLTHTVADGKPLCECGHKEFANRKCAEMTCTNYYMRGWIERR